ncbi:MAG: prevent-host-death protein [Actinomycetaceae bacterium]|nr:prevent-host-death protein [Actinomycetaceae bacterium]
MVATISQRELRNDSGSIMRQLDLGHSFIVTRHNEPVGELRPLRRHRMVDTHVALQAFRNAPGIDYGQFIQDIDAVVDQDIAPHV